MVAASAFGDSGADPFEQIFVQEYPRLVSVAYRITGNAIEAEDIAQETFVAFARRNRAHHPNAAAWLYRVAVHTALNAVRSHKRRAQRELRNYRLQQPIRTYVEAADDPQVLSERRHDRAVVRNALLCIREPDAQMLVLRYSGCSYREIAELLAIDISHVGTRLARAERALRKELERETS